MTNRTIDPYDDDFASLGGFFQSAEPPDFVKTAAKLTQNELAHLPDHCFALIARDHGNELRKFACADKAHTAVNVLYLSRYGDQLPHGALVKTASNLCLACERYGLDVPTWLRKLAEEIEGKPLIKTDSIPQLVHAPSAYPKGRDAAPTKPGDKATETNGVIRTKEVRKTASWDPYFDASGKWPEDLRVPAYQNSVTMRGRKFGLDDYAQVKKASDHFEYDWRVMHPQERREAALLIEKRASLMNVPTGPTLDKYACASFRDSSEIAQMFVDRAQRWPDDRAEAAAEIATELLEKQAALDPDTFAAALAELDIVTELDGLWGRSIPDPWETTLGKTASEKRKWNLGKIAVDEDTVRSIAAQKDRVAEAFGEDLATGLAQDPVAVFDSLPMDTQTVLANMASA